MAQVDERGKIQELLKRKIEQSGLVELSPQQRKLVTMGLLYRDDVPLVVLDEAETQRELSDPVFALDLAPGEILHPLDKPLRVDGSIVIVSNAVAFPDSDDGDRELLSTMFLSIENIRRQGFVAAVNEAAAWIHPAKRHWASADVCRAFGIHNDMTFSDQEDPSGILRARTEVLKSEHTLLEAQERARGAEYGVGRARERYEELKTKLGNAWAEERMHVELETHIEDVWMPQGLRWTTVNDYEIFMRDFLRGRSQDTYEVVPSPFQAKHFEADHRSYWLTIPRGYTFSADLGEVLSTNPRKKLLLTFLLERGARLELEVPDVFTVPRILRLEDHSANYVVPLFTDTVKEPSPKPLDFQPHRALAPELLISQGLA